MAFGFFKKKKKEKELHYDPTNIGIMDVRKGFILEYDLKTWEVIEEAEYDWGDEFYTYEFTIECGTERLFLYVEKDDEIEITLSTKINFGMLDEEVEAKIEKKGRPPKKVKYDGKTYYRDSESPGHYRNLESENWLSFVSWTYYDESGKYTLGIEEWSEGDYAASCGVVAQEIDFSNILPV